MTENKQKQASTVQQAVKRKTDILDHDTAPAKKQKGTIWPYYNTVDEVESNVVVTEQLCCTNMWKLHRKMALHKIFLHVCLETKFIGSTLD